MSKAIQIWADIYDQPTGTILSVCIRSALSGIELTQTREPTEEEKARREIPGACITAHIETVTRINGREFRARGMAA